MAQGGIGMINFLDFVLIPVFAHFERVMPATLKALLHVVEYRGRLVQLASRQVDGQATVDEAKAQTDLMLSNAGIAPGHPQLLRVPESRRCTNRHHLKLALHRDPA